MLSATTTSTSPSALHTSTFFKIVGRCANAFKSTPTITTSLSSPTTTLLTVAKATTSCTTTPVLTGFCIEANGRPEFDDSLFYLEQAGRKAGQKKDSPISRAFIAIATTILPPPTRKPNHGARPVACSGCYGTRKCGSPDCARSSPTPSTQSTYSRA